MKIPLPLQSLFVRYSVLALLGVFVIPIFGTIFTPLTLFPSFWLFSLFFETVRVGNILIVDAVPIELIAACIAPSAYYLLTVLNLATPNIKVKKRISMLAFAFLVFLLLNIVRIVLLGTQYLVIPSFFDFTHRLVWYALSTLFVVGIWFFQVKRYSIKEIPFFTDARLLYKHSLFKKN